jgi:MFS family permease
MRSRGSKGLILAAMIAAVAMMFIDQTIVAIAIPGLEQDLSLSATGAQWIINGYLLALRSPRTRQGAGRLLRHHWGHDLDRAGRRRLPHGVDVAGDLLDQRPGLGHRARPHRPGAHR